MSATRFLYLMLAASVAIGCLADSDDSGAPGAPSSETAALTLETSVWVSSASDRAFQTTQPPPGAPTSVALYSARNEYQAAQVLFRSDLSQQWVTATATSLTGPGGATIPTSAIKVTAVEYHSMYPSAGESEVPPGTPGTPGTLGRYGDALIAAIHDHVSPGTTVAFHYSVYTAAAQTPGRYTGAIQVRKSIDGGAPLSVPVTVTVYDVTLPPTNAATFKLNNWFTSAGWDYRGTEAAIPLQYGVTMFEEPWWTVIRNIAANMARHRNNVIHTDPTGLLLLNLGITGCTTVDQATCVYTFGPDAWRDFDRFVKTFIDTGALQYISTTPFIVHGYVHIPWRQPGGPRHAVKVPWDSAAGQHYLTVMLPELKRHLDEKGWTSKLYINGQDEPVQGSVQASQWLYGAVRTAWGCDPVPAPCASLPRTIEAHSNLVTGLEDLLSTISPILFNDDSQGDGGYDKYPAPYQQQRLAGKELWLYTSQSPHGAYMNRLIPYHLNKTRMLPWLVWTVGGNGYLHWGWNCWFRTGDNPPQFVDTHDGLLGSNGDFWLVRPDPEHLDVTDSLRSENQLYGVQDFELLNLLRQRKPLLAASIAATMVTSFTLYSRSGERADQAHKQILDALTASETADARFPFADDFASGTDGHWAHDRGQWTVSNQEYRQTLPSPGWRAVSGLKGRAYGDVVVTLDVRIDNDAGDERNWAGVVVRNLHPTDADTGYLVGLRNNGRLFVYRSGTTLIEDDVEVPDYEPGRFTRLVVVAQGSTIKVIAGNVASNQRTLTVTDTAYASGGIGLVAYSGASFRQIAVNAEQNLAEGKDVTASSTDRLLGPGWARSALVDGQSNSAAGAGNWPYTSFGWSSLKRTSAASTESVTVDLGKPAVVSRVDLLPRNDPGMLGRGFPVDFTIKVSNNQTTWTTVTTRTAYPKPGTAVPSFVITPTKARYVKIEATRLAAVATGDYRLQLAELRVYGGNLAAGQSCTASSSYESPAEGWGVLQATNGATLSTLGYFEGWSSAASTTGHEWIRVDLGAPSRFSSVILHPRNDGANTGLGFPIDFTIQTSNDGVTWTARLGRGQYPRPGHTPQVFTFPAVTARYVKIDGTRLGNDPQGSPRMQLAEIVVQ